MAVDAATTRAGVTDDDEVSTSADESAESENTDPADYDAAPDDAANPDGDADPHLDADGPPPSDDSGTDAASRQPLTPLRLAAIVGLVVAVAVGALAGWLGVRAYHAEQAKAIHNEFLQVAKQGALNLTTIGYQDADTDVQRIMDSATGEFLDEFSQNAEPFVDVVKKAQSSSQGTVSEAGLESVSGDEAQAIVAVAVKTTIQGGPEQPLRSWRLRLTVEKSGEDFKISKVRFV